MKTNFSLDGSVEKLIEQMDRAANNSLDMERFEKYGYVTAEEEQRRGEEWAKAMGTGYPSPVESSGPVDQHHQNPSGEAKGHEIESRRAGYTEAGEHEKHES
jgi:hypothetical protein